MVAVRNSEIQACTACLLIIANGEDTSLSDHGAAHAKQMEIHYGPGVSGLVCGTMSDEDLGFCSTPCEVCGEPSAGNRHLVTELSVL